MKQALVDDMKPEFLVELNFIMATNPPPVVAYILGALTAQAFALNLVPDVELLKDAMAMSGAADFKQRMQWVFDRWVTRKRAERNQRRRR